MQISGQCLVCSSRTFFTPESLNSVQTCFFCLRPFFFSLELPPTRQLPVPAEPGLLQDEGRRPDEQDTVRSTQNGLAVQSVQPLKKLTDFKTELIRVHLERLRPESFSDGGVYATDHYPLGERGGARRGFSCDRKQDAAVWSV